VAEPPLERPRREGPGGKERQRFRAPRLTFRRLSGLDRSGPPPPQTQAGAPLNPWTIPNAIGFTRLALIPVFVILALSSDGGHDALAVTLFGVIGWGDYADGIAARVSGQYSRLGTLMDPVTDRLLVICGVIVTWRFDLLPRWALGVLIARELFVIGLARYGLRHGVDLRINWPGRLSVAPLMGALFFAMAGLSRFSEVLLYVGLALAFYATVLYLRAGLEQLRSRQANA
jgi:CDP-diacylglycerol--glycerol-3-phosphate 3-phosphatidyltransferase